MTEISYRIPQQRVLRTALPGPRSQELAVRRKGAVAAGVGSTAPVYTADADGGVIVDVDGNALIDLAAGIAVTNVGASHPKVVAAIKDQAERFTHTCFMVAPYEGYIEVAEQLAALTPGDHEKRSVLFNSGAEAVENAIKVARLATGRPAVVAFDHAY
ncbi:aminotransferase class III-fold pyridoxal phosphate-dependent enzyme, partial [Nocardia sp. NPDC059154]